MRKRIAIDAGNRPLVTEDGYIDRGALLALYDQIRANARDRGARLTDEEAWGAAWSAASALWQQEYNKERVTA